MPVHHILCGLAANPALSSELVDRLIAIADDGIAISLLTHLARTAKIGATLLPRIAAASPAEVEELATSPDLAARMLVAQRRDLPPEIRNRLAGDPGAKVVKALARHPGLSETQLRAMVDRHGIRVLAKVATNPDASPALLEDLVQHKPAVQKVFREVARHRSATASALLVCLTDQQARPVAAGHPAVPPPVLTELLADGEGVVRRRAYAASLT
ncbi:hypothetical protein ABT373_26810 [Streptomyces sp. NPDC000070]|uniref:hypothetical protein n=1 Tax=Streptomyces sp. NPDC000070 TaxID=3154240 RepID=UPI003324A446